QRRADRGGRGRLPAGGRAPERRRHARPRALGAGAAPRPRAGRAVGRPARRRGRRPAGRARRREPRARDPRAAQGATGRRAPRAPRAPRGRRARRARPVDASAPGGGTMSAEAAVTRVGEIQAMLGALRGQGPATGGATPPSTDFAAKLQSATAATAATAAPVATAAVAGGSSTPYDALITESAQ